MKLNDVIYTTTLGEVLTTFIRRNPDFIKTFMSGSIASSIDVMVSPQSITLTRDQLKDAVAFLRVTGKI